MDTSCWKLRDAFGERVELVQQFAGRSPSKQIADRIKKLDVCFYVPNRWSPESWINDDMIIRLEADPKNVIALSKVFEASSGKLSFKFSTKFKVVGKMRKQLDALYGKKSYTKVQKSNYLDNIRKICVEDKEMRNCLNWMKEARYFVLQRNIVNKFPHIEETCELLESVGSSILQEKL